MPRKPSDADEEKKPPKPKKVFTYSVEFWDDGEVSYSRVEKVAQERGAPKNLVYLNGSEIDFVNSLKGSLAKDKYEILQALIKGVSITEDEVKLMYVPKKGEAKKEEPQKEEKPVAKKEAPAEGFDFDK